MPVLRAAGGSEELAMLRAVVADLGDLTTLSIYCDWLEDHNDPRGPFLRSFLQAFWDRAALPPDPLDLDSASAWADLLAIPIRRRLLEGYDRSDADTRDWVARELPDGFAPLEPYIATILQAAQPVISIAMGRARPMDEHPLGASRAGGVPDLPFDSTWPMTVCDVFGGEWPLQFLMQIDLTDRWWKDRCHPKAY